MKETWIKYKEWWANLTSRERKYIILGAVSTTFFIVYQWIWTPYLETVALLRKQIHTNLALLEWMQLTDKEMRQLETQLRVRKQPDSPVVFLSVMQHEVNQVGLNDFLTQLKQSTNDTVEMHFQNVEFDKLISLLISVVRKQNVSISKMSVTTDNAVGLVNADLILKIG